MDTAAYIARISDTITSQFPESMSRGTKTAACNLVKYYLVFSEEEQRPRHMLDEAVLKHAFNFCTGPLPSDLPVAERSKLTGPGQRDYNDAVKYLFVALESVLKKDER